MRRTLSRLFCGYCSRVRGGRTAYPDGYGLTQFRYHYRQNTVASKEKKASTILTDLYVGGEKAFLDYAGDTLGYIDYSYYDFRDENLVESYCWCYRDLFEQKTAELVNSGAYMNLELRRIWEK